MTDSNNGVSLIQSGAYDGISASGDATTRLIHGRPREAHRHVDLRQLRERLRQPQEPAPQHGRWRELRRAARPWREPAGLQHDGCLAGADAAGPRSGRAAPNYKGKISIYDSSIFIADAALHLRPRILSLGITDIYQLNDAQFSAAIDLLKTLKARTSPFIWGTAADQVQSYQSGDVVVGTTWQYQVNLAAGRPASRSRLSCLTRAQPVGRTPGWMYSQAAHPNCMLLWMDWMMSPMANALATIWFGEAPTSQAACADAEKHLARILRPHATRPTRRTSRRSITGQPRRPDCKDDDPQHDLQDPGRLGPGVDGSSRQLIRHRLM